MVVNSNFSHWNWSTDHFFCTVSWLLVYGSNHSTRSIIRLYSIQCGDHWWFGLPCVWPCRDWHESTFFSVMLKLVFRVFPRFFLASTVFFWIIDWKLPSSNPLGKEKLSLRPSLVTACGRVPVSLYRLVLNCVQYVNMQACMSR